MVPLAVSGVCAESSWRNEPMVEVKFAAEFIKIEQKVYT